MLLFSRFQARLTQTFAISRTQSQACLNYAEASKYLLSEFCDPSSARLLKEKNSASQHFCSQQHNMNKFISARLA